MAPPSLSDRFADLLRWLLTGIGLEQRRLRLGWELREAIARRVVGLWTRMQRVFARLRAGTLGPPRLRASRARAAAGRARRSLSGRHARRACCRGSSDG